MDGTLASEASARYRGHMRASRIWGARSVGMLWPPAVERRLRRMFALGRERTIEQDQAFALRILVDIAIRALSPAVIDPTTAVQVLDYIEDLLLVIGRHDLHGHGEVVMGRPRPRPWSQCAAKAELRRQRPSEHRRAMRCFIPSG